MLQTKAFFIWILALYLVSPFACAKTRIVEVRLMQLEAKKTASHTGDHVYFTVTEYPNPNKGEPSLLRIPIYPLHWLSKDLPSMGNVKLWQGEIEDNAGMLLIFSLMVQNFPLFDTDKLVGSTQVKLVNKDNKIDATWGQPHYVDQPKVEQPGENEPKYMLFGDNSEYQVVFKVNELRQ